MESKIEHQKHIIPWNKGKLVGQKTALKLKEMWGIYSRLKIDNNTCELTLFNSGSTKYLKTKVTVKVFTL
ncbi:MAG: hypothetical protein GQ546_12055 [Gammaproteobacteria bacterium]|jgi:hypothetical protein|nr:hypothetical protein [Gammaproteobacteria bacterium]